MGGGEEDEAVDLVGETLCGRGLVRMHSAWPAAHDTMGEQLDRAYIDRWIRQLGLDGEWAVALKTSA